MTYTMTVNTTPVPKGRPRFYGGHAVTPEKTRVYEALLRHDWPHGIVQGDALKISMAFAFPPPTSLSKRKQDAMMYMLRTKKPDLDNLVKAVLDALNGVAFDDDSKVAEIFAQKLYAPEPYVEVKISSYDQGGIG